jgi:hypothetical protein
LEVLTDVEFSIACIGIEEIKFVDLLNEQLLTVIYLLLDHEFPLSNLDLSFNSKQHNIGSQGEASLGTKEL